MMKFEHAVIFRTDLKNLKSLNVPEKTMMAVVTMTENYALITFYDLLNEIISVIEPTKEELEAVNLCPNILRDFAI